MSEPLYYLLPDEFDLDLLVERIADLYAVKDTGTESFEKLYMDTWNWSLFNKGISLHRKGIRYVLEKLSGTTVECINGSRKKYPFWWDFQDEQFRKELMDVTDIRSLMPRIGVTGIAETFSLHNKDDKIVLRLSRHKYRVEIAGETRLLDDALVLEPLRGYKKPIKVLRKLLGESGLQVHPGKYNLIIQVHKLFGIDPQASDAKFSAELDHEQTVAQAVRDVCLTLRAAMLRNLPGTLEDIDSEFLHDLRVSVRRTRSLLSLMKKYLPPEDIAHFQTEFKWVGTVTGAVRDLDVYLLNADKYREMLPEELYPGLEWFIQALQRQRKRQLRLLREHLKSERFTQLAVDWEKFLLELPQRENNPSGEKNCREAAEKIIRKRFKRILKNGSAITKDTSDDKLHELRIEGKKFRYILEFFRSLFYAESVDSYLKQMKKLQNNLGDFNDYSVQKNMLIVRLSKMRPAPHAIETAAALGGLIVHLGDRQVAIRRKFERTFQDFATPDNIALLEGIFESVTVSSEKREGE